MQESEEGAMNRTAAEKTRPLIVFDGTAWFVRKVRAIEHDLALDEKVYHCNEHIAGPCKTLAHAVKALEAWEAAR